MNIFGSNNLLQQTKIRTKNLKIFVEGNYSIEKLFKIGSDSHKNKIKHTCHRVFKHTLERGHALYIEGTGIKMATKLYVCSAKSYNL